MKKSKVSSGYLYNASVSIWQRDFQKIKINKFMHG